VTVPNRQPRTKPRALNYALQVARGTLVAVFDAEDIPDADELRRAANAFIEGGPRLACVQAQLAIYNDHESFLTRQFALKYSALFSGLLPALGFLRLPVTLGGTSNHFRRDLLLKIGGWDPFNVTEDADLGIRLARFGYEVSVIDSVTMEEAPASWRNWRGQRTRWIKGWIQTYLVHMRRPLRLWRDLGAWRFAGFQLTIGATILSLLVHPWFASWQRCTVHSASASCRKAICSFGCPVQTWWPAMAPPCCSRWPQLSRQARRAGCCPSYGCRSIGLRSRMPPIVPCSI
jgi:glycosyltransferase XagB